MSALSYQLLWYFSKSIAMIYFYLRRWTSVKPGVKLNSGLALIEVKTATFLYYR